MSSPAIPERPARQAASSGYYPGTEFGLDSRELVGREASVLGSRGSTRSDAAAALAAVERGEIRPVIDSVWELARAAEAVALLRSRRALGPGSDRCLSAVCACACCRACRSGEW